ncbi:hypothetical protein GCM10010365_50770 [Streptomyces poonensis]|uniref:Uncharacterized protein n=1 Tax=Streptomyces poonensis TaxID=68255 RepID=A0A918PXC2_9ACTN|nr:hypothetical protein GCM10010365_50770 [Streptomyces poonensis]GLJ89963.1 hypothetical protein GCM10017589_25640 [Streptomyces poonensis]
MGNGIALTPPWALAAGGAETRAVTTVSEAAALRRSRRRGAWGRGPTEWWCEEEAGAESGTGDGQETFNMT